MLQDKNAEIERQVIEQKKMNDDIDEDIALEEEMEVVAKEEDELGDMLADMTEEEYELYLQDIYKLGDAEFGGDDLCDDQDVDDQCATRDSDQEGMHYDDGINMLGSSISGTKVSAGIVSTGESMPHSYIQFLYYFKIKL